MVALATVEEAKTRTRIDDEAEDDEVEAIVDQATAIVVKHLKKPDHGWTPETVPADIKAAVLVVSVRIYDDPQGDELWLNQTVRDLLNGHRDPALA